MKEFTAHFIVKNGFPEYRNPAYLINLQKFEGCQGQMTVKKKWSKRTLSQNSLYWLWLGVISVEIGHTEDDLHTIFKGLYGHKKVVKIKDKEYRIPRSTTTYTKGEFVEYLFNIEQEVAKMGIILPQPADLQMPVWCE